MFANNSESTVPADAKEKMFDWMVDAIQKRERDKQQGTSR